ncbi:thiamine phosphate synthase, partial [bacterium]|nr:thiamine phosphate synthase [bacterium]
MAPALDPARARSALLQARLYAILDASYAAPSQWPTLATQLAEGGVGIFQLRGKKLTKDEILTSAKVLAALLARRGLPLILNDHPDLVVPSGAAGCHLGQDDLGIPEARRL